MKGRQNKYASYLEWLETDLRRLRMGDRERDLERRRLTGDRDGERRR